MKNVLFGLLLILTSCRVTTNYAVRVSSDTEDRECFAKCFAGKSEVADLNACTAVCGGKATRDEECGGMEPFSKTHSCRDVEASELSVGRTVLLVMGIVAAHVALAYGITAELNSK